MSFSTDGCYDNPAQASGGDGYPGVYDSSEGLAAKKFLYPGHSTQLD